MSVDPSLCIRVATEHDMAACAALNADFPTRQYYDLTWHQEEEGWTARLRLAHAAQPDSGSYDFDEAHLLSELEKSDLFLVAEQDGRVAAFCNGHLARWNNTFFVHNLIVGAPYRGRGLGSALLDRAIGYARERGARAVMLETQGNNVNAVRFYLAKGFRLSGLRDDLFSNRDIQRHQVALYFSRALTDRGTPEAEGES